MNSAEMVKQLATVIYDTPPFRILCIVNDYEVELLIVERFGTYINVSDIHSYADKCTRICVDTPRIYGYKPVYNVLPSRASALQDAFNTMKELADYIYGTRFGRAFGSILRGIRPYCITYPDNRTVFAIAIDYYGMDSDIILVSKPPFRKVSYARKFNREFERKILEYVYRLIVKDLFQLYMYPKIFMS